ncbi:PRC-barrel domain-containing protein [Gilvimarinus algae]|uniref:PRC-barrel domain-containing protein n=1 Tax=Gilvimarinus algae TaxID=3058037 RepID=A0ABT8TIN9_9GAMM|nr:PRC-barrel domain-containing protein [Gilvimarinus sp. SDUM040014]MDO3382948.1 PRC-barrel domain-containing protein [Gilvimarinus sp. SDUM040014]
MTIKTHSVAKTLSLTLAGALMCSSMAMAAGMEKSQAEKSVYDSSVNLQAFSQIDKDGSGDIQFSELKDVYQKDLTQRGWSEDMLMSRFDSDDNQRLNSEEYSVFARELLRSDRLSEETGGLAMNGAEGQPGPEQIQQRHSGANDSLAGAEGVTEEMLEDREVVNRSGDTVGEVEDVMIERGKVTNVVVSVGGFANIGDKDVLVDARQLRLQGNQLLWDTPLDENMLDNMPEYDEDKYSAVIR